VAACSKDKEKEEIKVKRKKSQIRVPSVGAGRIRLKLDVELEKGRIKGGERHRRHDPREVYDSWRCWECVVVTGNHCRQL